jgi:hypothetical protein
MDIAEYIYNLAQRKQRSESFVLELSYDEFETYAVSIGIRFHRGSGRINAVYKGTNFHIRTATQMRFVIDMLLPNALVEMMKYANMPSTSEYTSISIRLVNGMGKALTHFRHPLTAGFSDIYLLDPASWETEENLADVSRTVHMTCSLMLTFLCAQSPTTRQKN